MDDPRVPAFADRAWSPTGEVDVPVAGTKPRERTVTVAAPPRPAWWTATGRPGARLVLLLADLVALAAAAWLVGESWAVAGTRTALVLVIFAAAGLYRPRLTLSALDDVPRIAGAVAVTGLALPVLGDWTGSTDLGAAGWAGTAAALAAVVLARTGAYAFVRRARTLGGLRHRVLIIGAGQVGVRLARRLQDNREYGLDPVGFLDRHPQLTPPESLPAPVLGTPNHLSAAIRTFSVTRVIVAFSYERESDLVDVLRTCDRLRCEIMYVPRLFELHSRTSNVDEVHGIPLVRINRAAFRTFGWRLKRVFDICLSGLALVLLSPVLAACAVAVRVHSGPGVLFYQERVGLDGRPFQMLKFRSLRPLDESEASVTWTVHGDDRLGKVGRFLRATSLDELPQLWNVFRGDMSLVGPRPERPHFVSQFSGRIPRYTGRHRVPAGMTGWAQVNGLRGDTSIEDRATFDNYYIENWSLWGDVKILVRTVGQVLRRQGS